MTLSLFPANAENVVSCHVLALAVGTRTFIDAGAGVWDVGYLPGKWISEGASFLAIKFSGIGDDELPVTHDRDDAIRFNPSTQKNTLAGQTLSRNPSRF